MMPADVIAIVIIAFTGVILGFLCGDRMHDEPSSNTGWTLLLDGLCCLAAALVLLLSKPQDLDILTWMVTR